MKNESAGNEIGSDLKMATAKQVQDETQACMNNIGQVQLILQKQGKVVSTSFSLNYTKNRKLLIIEREHLLLLWIKDCNFFLNPNQFGQHSGQSIEVIASKGCFNHFKSWHDLTNVNLADEATSTGEDTVLKFALRFQVFVKAGGYDDHQPLNVDETGLF